MAAMSDEAAEGRTAAATAGTSVELLPSASRHGAVGAAGALSGRGVCAVRSADQLGAEADGRAPLGSPALVPAPLVPAQCAWDGRRSSARAHHRAVGGGRSGVSAPCRPAGAVRAAAATGRRTGPNSGAGEDVGAGP